MARFPRALLAVTTASLTAFALVACGGGDDDSSSGGDCTEGDGLTVGTILPQTGSLAFLGPPEFAGVDLAVEEINEFGGVLDTCVEVLHEDSGDTTTDIASQAADALIAQDVNVVIGAASSGVSFQFIDKLYEEGIVQISPANTSPDFTTYERGDYYFRTAPSDILQGRVLADTLIADGHQSIAILALQDAYGTGLADSIEQNFTDFGGEVALKTIYDPAATEFSAEVGQVADANVDAVVLVTFNEIVNLGPALAEGGLSAQDLGWYLVDGNLADYSADFPAGFMEGAKGTFPGADPEPIRDRLLEIDPDLTDFTYGPESYDATALAALAAIAGDSYDSETIKDNLVDVSTGGTKCTGFTECAELLAEDNTADIDYDGYSGPIEFSPEGDVTAATIGVYQYLPDNTYENLTYTFGDLNE
ncbi:ABC transporter substrate-binding protein [Glycomyces harbinensis]|uniref:Branched-chain amino acid transport system substrate-binding protein n=1 Tax=Glycomyces harbinensis TaxID=58114 RepID=A0A1G6T565_9ACTN|nr:ABC transporter substrate-binding protein [Glycomyces harbinensis]SDD23676.1 branched-chain amino acid transport system substrate-binding protein [Glycomyces harbinensis]